MSEQKSAFEQLLDLFVYAPVGMALTATEELPKLIEKGRSRVTGQVTMARMMGQFAVSQGQQQAEKLVRDATERLSDLGVVPGSRPAASTAAAPSRPPAPAAEAASGGAPAHHDREPATGDPAPSSNGSGAATTAEPANTAATTGTAAAASGASKPSRPTAGNGAGAAPPADSLAIPGYDSLSASQVVQRLAGLAGDELEAVRSYESATRGRKTILSRISQLQSGTA